jgi:hypothetical protein
MVLPPETEAKFTWIDRRPISDWADIYRLHISNNFNYPELRIPALPFREKVMAVLRRQPLAYARERKVARSGFRVVCETRSSERVATVWRAEVQKAPVMGVRDMSGRLVFKESLGAVSGAIDDTDVFYRVDFDSSLALLDIPKIRHLPGRHG